MVWRTFALICALVLPQLGQAQGAATLVADTVFVTGDQRLVAQVLS